MNATFREYVTEQAFSLTLKKTHIFVLAALMRGESGRGYGFNLFVPSVNGLIRRGLVIHHAPQRGHEPTGDLRNYYEITEAGKLAFALLVEAGMIHPEMLQEQAA